MKKSAVGKKTNALSEWNSVVAEGFVFSASVCDCILCRVTNTHIPLDYTG
jgi:hypothetical protein